MPVPIGAPPPARDALSRWLRAGLTTAVVDGLFSSILSAFFYGSSVRALFQGVASVPLGRQALDGGWTTACLGILMHVGVAFFWSAVFLGLYQGSAWIRERVASRAGVFVAAAIFGPCVWMAMSLAVVPMFTRRLPPIAFRWWVQFVGHAPCVGLPIVGSIARRTA